MIVDSSAALAVVFGEPGFEIFVNAILSGDCKMSAATFVETMIVAESRGADRAARHVETFFRDIRIETLPLTVEQAYLAVRAFSKYGKGRHTAGLNYGDCFSYALAKDLDEPLLFKGNDFRKTDVKPVLP
jgi:ribonuclease VapC